MNNILIFAGITFLNLVLVVALFTLAITMRQEKFKVGAVVVAATVTVGCGIIEYF